MDLLKMTVNETVRAIKNRDYTARELAEAALSRVDASDSPESGTGAFIRVTAPLALKQADNIDKMAATGADLPPLAGVPVAIRDDLCLEGVEVTCASEYLKGFVSPYSAEVVKKAVDNGAVVIGKANLDEFGMGSDTATSKFHLTRNPLNHSLVAGDGVAAAVAAGYALLGIGADTGGVLREGASYCGLYALRPTPGLVSRYGLASFASSMSQVGFMARQGEDLLTVIEAVAGFDARDSATGEYQAVPEKNDRNKGCKWEDLTIGWPEDILSTLSEPVRKIMDETRERLAAMGITFKEISLPHFAPGLMAFYIIVMAESFSNMSRYDGIRYGNYYQGENLEEWYQKTRQQSLGFEVKRRSILGAHLLNKEHYDLYYTRARRVWTLVKEDFAKALQDCDMILLPATRGPAFPLDSLSGPLNNGTLNIDGRPPDDKLLHGKYPDSGPLHRTSGSSPNSGSPGEEVPNGRLTDNSPPDITTAYEGDQFCAPVSLAGLPAVVFPAGIMGALPVGAQLVGAPFSEKLLIDVVSRVDNPLHNNGTGV